MKNLLGVTILEMLVLGALASGLALAGNALRQDGLQITRNYFEKPKVNLPPPLTPAPAVPITIKVGTQTSADGTGPATETTSPTGATGAPTPGPEPAPPPAGHQGEWQEQPRVNPAHGLLAIGYQQALKIYQDPMYLDGLCIFVDARSDAAYGEGHIPGAYQLDHYHLERYLPEVLPAAQRADRIVLYCEGGDCEDSIFAANDLLEQDIEYDHLLIYEGGIEEWERNGAPLELGGR